MSSEIVNIENIQHRIYTIRGMQVMLDSDLAELYRVSTSRLNEQVKRNSNRFPVDFMFQLSDNEWKNLISQNAISSWGGRRKLPNMFTEQGVASLSGILTSEVAIEVNISIMRAFVKLRKFILKNASIFQRINTLEIKQIETDKKLDKVFKALENKNTIPKQGIFFDGQIFDAYKFVSDIVRTAKKTIVLIDNYVDNTVLTLLSKKRKKIQLQ
ncbi:MAG: ORF6N domain-containing protein [Bacteroidales bacterium]|nr:ORF6N domain-containing protein [Bacteroidales bacterium]